jgi:hypothetical protein
MIRGNALMVAVLWGDYLLRRKQQFRKRPDLALATMAESFRPQIVATRFGEQANLEAHTA